MTSLATWKVEVVTVPPSTGSVPYTFPSWGGKTPQALICCGTNWLTEDTAQTGNGLGLFRGMAAPKWDALSTINQNAAAVISTPSGNAHVIDNGYVIRMPDTSGVFSNYLYLATLTSFDVNGFTLQWDIVAAGGYKVVVIALFDVDSVSSIIGTFDGTGRNLGFKAGSSLLHGAWAGPATGLSDRTQEFYGGAAYPSGDQGQWEAAGATVFCFPTSASGQYVNDLSNFPPHIRVATGGHFTGPFLVTSNILAYPTGSPSAGNNFLIGGDSFDGGMVLIWDDEDSRCFYQNPAQNTGNTSTKTGLPFEPGLLLGYTISDEPSGQGTGSRGAIGFGVVTPDFQWCATVDGSSSQGAFQSFQRGIADTVNGTSVHAATCDLTDDGFVLTTEEDDTTLHDVVWHAFGHAVETVMWIPHIYRRVSG